MSATRYRQFALLLSAILRTTLLHGSDSATNSNNGNFLLSVSLADKPNKEFVPLTIGDARGSLRLDSLTNSSSGNSNALLLTVTKVGDRCGVLFVRSFETGANRWYDLNFRARTEKRENDRGYGLTVSLQSRDGKQLCARTTLPEVGGEWRDYTVALHSRFADPAATLSISISEPGTIWFDEITLTQRQTGREKQPP